MSNERYVAMLNKALSKEITAIIMYRWQSIVVRGAIAESVSSVAKDISEDEVHHALGLADKIDYFCGMPTFQLDNPVLCTDPMEVIREDIRREEDAIALYKQLVRDFRDESGVQWMLQEFLQDEEQHLVEFRMFEEESLNSDNTAIVGPISNVAPLPGFLQGPSPDEAPGVELEVVEEEQLPATLTVIPRMEALVKHLRTKRSGQNTRREAAILADILTQFNP